MDNYEVLYIEPTVKEIKDLREIIKKQGDKTCNYKINTGAIVAAATNFNFGWISAIKKAQIGRRSIKNFNDQHTLRAFILCVVNPQIPNTLKIDIVCSTNKSGKFLISLAEDKAKSMNITNLILFALPNPRLVEWYKSLGFELLTDIDSVSDPYKLYLMQKRL